MLSNLSSHQLSFLIILGCTLVLLISERIRKDVVALLVILALYLAGLLTSDQAVSGFSSEPAIVVAAIFVLTGALHQTGLSDRIGAWISRLAGAGYNRMILVIMPAVAVLSAFTHHVMTTAMMIPVILNLSRERKIAASKLLMPMSFAASLGTAITIIGAPAFLVASATLKSGGRRGLGIFEIAPIGLSLSLIGTVFVLLVGRFLLPTRETGEDTSDLFRLDKYLTEVIVLPNSGFKGKSLAEIEASEQYHFNLIGWLRNGRRLRRPLEKYRFEEGDILLVHATPEDILNIQNEAGVDLHPIKQYGDESHKPASGEDEKDTTDALVQAIIAPDSDLIGRTMGEIDFRRRFGPVVVGLWRQDTWLHQELSKVQLREGDVLLLLGTDESLARVGNDPNFLMLIPFQGEFRPRRKARRAGLIMLLSVIAAASNLMTLEMAVLAGALAMILTGCLTPRQAYKSMDAQLYIFIAGAIPLGAAMEKTGTAALFATGLKMAIGGLNEVAVLFILFAITGMITQFMSDAATTALLAPVAMELARVLGHSPEAYVVTVAMASVVSFITPIGHHGNLLIYGPGRYQFADFVKVGTPLTILIGITVSVLAHLIWG